ncbi:isoamyl acetate-hydrolyzing esterase [Coemansia sp. RSA 552]|nr:isoamyl acetate-hydrolyzing esterase [Coemansia sp. RSA 552]
MRRSILVSAACGLCAVLAVNGYGACASGLGQRQPQDQGQNQGQDQDQVQGELHYEYTKYDVLYAFGDSITQRGYDIDTGGWVARLGQLYQRYMDVLNRGFQSYNTEAAREIVDRVFPVTSAKSTSEGNGPRAQITSKKSKRGAGGGVYTKRAFEWPEDRKQSLPGNNSVIQLCFIFFGANDAKVESAETYVPIDTFGDNLEYFISLLQDSDSPHYSPNARIVVITPPPAGDLLLEAMAEYQGGEVTSKNGITKEYAQRALGVAQQMNVASIDLYTEMENAVQEYVQGDGKSSQYAGYDKYLVDGIHLSYDGNKLLYDLIVDLVNTTWPEIMPSPPLISEAPKGSILAKS